ncbi:MAG: sigma-70 family RNA polymerase sigma factor [Ruminococcaceae bacterium]|nr:sigma-70 family RNA polymerase sigma factor [Oscillospiraceae bacterium]
MEEKKLIQQAAAGDTAAFEALVLRYQTQVYSLAYRMVGNEADAQDLAQEAFVRAWRALDSFQFSSQFSTWLYRLTSNICIDFLRSQKKRKHISLTVLQDDEQQQWDMPDHRPLPEEQMIVTQEREALAKAIAALDPEYRQVLILRIVNDCSYQQISEIMGIREGTVKSRLSRAREQLRKKLAQSGNFSGSSSSNSVKGG